MNAFLQRKSCHRSTPANQSIQFTGFQCFAELLNFYAMNSNVYIYYYWLSRWYCAKK